MDKFFKQETCDRCRNRLTGGRTMSRYNEDCICMKCAAEERERADYKEASEAEAAEVKKGNYDYPGIGL